MNLMIVDGTTTVMLDRVARRGCTRTVLPVAALEKYTVSCEAPDTKFLPLIVSTLFTGTSAGENEVTTGRREAAKDALAIRANARMATEVVRTRRRMHRRSAICGNPLGKIERLNG